MKNNIKRKISSLLMATIVGAQLFAGAVTATEVETPVVTESIYIPELAFVSHFDGGLLLSWRNPTASSLDDVKLYDITGGQNKLLTADESDEPYARVQYCAEGLTNGTAYQYKLVFSFSNREETVYYLTGTPEVVNTASTDNRIKSINGWTSLIRNQTKAPNYEKRAPFKASLDSVVKRGESGSSLRIQSNAPASVSGFNNMYMLVQSAKGFELKGGKTYKLSYWVKTRNLAQYLMHISWDNFGRTTAEGPVKDTTDWTYCEQICTLDADKTKRQLMIQGKYTGTVWFDDMELYEVVANGTDAEGNTIYEKAEGAENIIVNGTFDTNKGVCSIEGVNAVASDEEITLSWSGITPDKANLDYNPSYARDEYTGINVYEFINGAYEFRGTIACKEASITLPVTKTGEHKYRLVPMDIYGVEGTASEVSVTVPKNESIYQPKSAMTRQFNGGLLLSWRNPESIDLENVTLYDVTTGKSVLLSDSISDEPSKYVLYSVDNLAANSAHLYKAVFEFDNHDTIEYYFNGLATTGLKEPDPTSTSNVSFGFGHKVIGKWNIRAINNSHQPQANPATIYDNRIPFDFALDTKVKMGETGASLRFDSNAIDYDNPDAFAKMYSGADATSTVALKANTTYKMTFWAKSENLSRFCLHIDWNRFDGATSTTMPISGTTPWTKYEMFYTASADSNSTIRMQNYGTGTLWIDNMELYAWDTENDTVAAGAENLLAGTFGNFDLQDTFAKPTVGDVTNINYYGDTLLKFGAITDGTGVNLYELVDGKYESRGMISPYIRNVHLTINNPSEYATFMLVPVNNFGIEGEGTVFEYIPEINTEFVYVTEEGTTVAEKIEAGDYKVTATLPERTEDYNMSVAVALYNNNKLVWTDIKEGTVAGGTTKEYNFNITVPEITEGDSYKVKVMYWDGTETMVPAECAVLAQ